MFWGYIDKKGRLFVEEFKDRAPVRIAIDSPRVAEVFTEFEADSREDAINYIKKLKENE